MIDFGQIDISEAWLGNLSLDSIWFGSIKVWPDGEPPVPPTPTGYTFSVSPTALTTDADNKTVYFTVTTDSPQWTVSSTDNWVTVIGITGGTVEINIATNYGSIDRQGSLIFSYKESSTGGTGTITVGITQEMPIVYTFGVSPSSITLTSESSYGILTASGTTPHWEVNYYSDWITIDGITGNTIQASVSSNTGDTRQGGITFIYVDKSVGTVDSFTVSVVQEKAYVIKYKSASGNIVTPNVTAGWGANIISNTYSGGYGNLYFDAEPTTIPANAFSGNTDLDRIYASTAITSIGASAFGNIKYINIFYDGTYGQWLNVTQGTDSLAASATIHYKYNSKTSVNYVAYQSFTAGMPHQYMNLGIPLTTDTVITFNCRLVNLNVGSQMIGCRFATGDSDDFRFFITNSTIYFDWHNSRVNNTASNMGQSLSSGSTAYYQLSNFRVTNLSNSKYKSGTTQTTVPSPNAMLAVNTNKWWIKSVKITQGGVTKLDMSAAVCDNVAGFYDSVTDTFLTIDGLISS